MEHALGLHDEIDKNASATDDAVDVLMMSKPCKMKAPVDDGSGSSTSESTDVPQPISVKGDSTIHNMRSDHRACDYVPTELGTEGLSEDAERPTDLDDGHDETSDTLSMIDPVDLAAIIHDVATWEQPSHAASSEEPDPSVLMEELFGIQPSSLVHFPRPFDPSETDMTESSSPLQAVSRHVEVPSTEGASRSVSTTRIGSLQLSEKERCQPQNESEKHIRRGGINAMNLPNPVVQGNPKREKVLYWASKSSNRRYVDGSPPDESAPPNIAELVHWAKHTNSLQKVDEMIDRYPVTMRKRALKGRAPIVEATSSAVARGCCHAFDIPEGLVKSISAALLADRSAMIRKSETQGTNPSKSKHEIIDVDSSPTDVQEKIVKLKASGPSFSSNCVDAIRSFYNCRKQITLWEVDLTWQKKDWSKNSAVDVEFFAFEVSARELPREKVKALHVRLADGGNAGFESACLQSYYSVPSTKVTIFFWEIVGYITGTVWLNDSAVNCGLQAMAGCRPDVRILPSHVLKKWLPQTKADTKNV
ncbi:hypothetical protein PHYSODRAFT_293825 [Phytophthora sojae]|uniref:Ubiquitin-like protease family profile domain-containing protein n=1 Tax=Phytophthora sojae (strain P6497) TaxID=1094619 RepID=G4YMA7_PHYSP|nr:hypothetical protein PHYSODRAFT_293825 [Phytophthora sojae]EGZ28237.1 hypothetical protein PHYSODRAFT_293825 [Phytophthora sojae]|eukprot:XP_009515512.1 hypothetical protein PHYSODRAFT_293825 [Phytophthora sojae]